MGGSGEVFACRGEEIAAEERKENEKWLLTRKGGFACLLAWVERRRENFSFSSSSSVLLPPCPSLLPALAQF